MNDLLTTSEVAESLTLSPRTLARWRERQQGPPSLRLGRAVRYRRVDVEAWLHEQQVPARAVA